MKLTRWLMLVSMMAQLGACSQLIEVEEQGLVCESNADCDEGQWCLDTGCQVVVTECGNGEVELGEVCDDGYTDACGTCNADCSEEGTGASCGDGETCPETEACDDGFTDSCGTCNAECSAMGTGSLCGDGELCVEQESCDDGFTDSCGTCNADCSAVGAGSTCGDGQACPETEACDDGFTDACGTCNAECTAAGVASTCGDGEVCPETEVCEPDPSDSGDGSCSSCADDCSGPGTGVCGDGVVCDGFEVCDDGFTDACGSCNADCSAAGSGATCGDGSICPELETCDDGYVDACGSCNADCSGSGSAATCGDGESCPELEACDDGYNDACGSCNADCSAVGSGAVCGDDSICPELESCDDGYADACGSCNGTCTGAGSGATCGDNVACPELEACDDGFLDACGSCNADCSGAGSDFTCGDGSVCPEYELCDDGYTDSCGSCNASCNAAGSGATCGDGFACPELETCDDGYADGCGSCNADCSAAGAGSTCGDGLTCEEFEFCDDGNDIDSDGCTSSCTNGLCGDGLLNQRLLNTTSITFSWAAVRCGGNNSEGVFEVNGVEFARSNMLNECYCGDVDQSITVTDSDLMATLIDGSNTFDFRLDPIVDTYTYWAKATINDTGEQVIIYEQDSGTASFSAAIPCGENIAQVSPSVDSSAALYGAEPCDDGNTINGDGCDSNCTVTACGNGIAAGAEQCDTGGASATCNSDCTAVVCGDGKYNLSAGEGCDDGNTADGDGCSSTCQAEYCGDGTTQAALGELCDDGNQIGGDGCSFGCEPEGCGDGAVSVALGETCDDGNTDGADGCSESCEIECGDGALAATGVATSAKLKWKRSGYQCTANQASELWVYVDTTLVAQVPVDISPCGEYEAVIDSPALVGTLNGGTHDVEVVSIGCWIALWVDLELGLESGGVRTIPIFDPFDHMSGSPGCGDYEFLSSAKATVYGESCDDGGTSSGDGCSELCGVETCGNGVLDLGETCDDGNTASSDGCSSICEQEGCGDGVKSDTEECDDGNSNDNDGCSIDCLLEECGNGRTDPGETCDDNNLISGDGCSSLCSTEVCGNAIREVGEGCDDGNVEAGDGCSSSCEIEECTNVADTDGDGLADCVETNTGIFVSTSDTGTSATDPDSDDDGLPDGDEVMGTSGGLNLRGMGASPNHRDIFLEVDWTTDDGMSNCGGTELRPTQNAMEALVAAFAEAPVQNRDGTTGVSLHVDYGQGNGFEGGNHIAGSDSFLNGGLDGDFVNHKADNFASNREGYFHYVIQAYDFGDGGVSSGAGGLGYTPGFDYLVTQGCPKDGDVTTYLHELGHNLNLLHGGFEDCNYKPNYNSVMNYLYDYAFRDCGRNVVADLTYSSGVLADLNENSLDEAAGLCDAVAIDWNVDGVIGVVQYNANPEEASQQESCGGTYTVLSDHDDWANLVYLGPSNPGLLFPTRVLE